MCRRHIHHGGYPSGCSREACIPEWYTSGCGRGAYTPGRYTSGCVGWCIPRVVYLRVWYIPGCYSRSYLRGWYVPGVIPVSLLAEFPFPWLFPSHCWAEFSFSRGYSRFTVGIKDCSHVIPVSLLGVKDHLPGPYSLPVSLLGKKDIPAIITRFTVGQEAHCQHPFHCWSRSTSLAS